MEGLELNSKLIPENLFNQFSIQLKKEFEDAGFDSEFVKFISPHFEDLKKIILIQFKNNNRQSISRLINRVDISDIQLKTYQEKNSQLMFEEAIAELIIKRTLQKIILRKKFSL